MGNKILYWILFGWVKLHAMLPMHILYILSDIFYFSIYHVFRYRVKVVRGNMKNSFPGKTEKELKTLEKRFYHHFADYIIETIKLAHISEKELVERAHLNNPELILDLIDKGHRCLILLMGHYGNWEWFTCTGLPFQRRVQVYMLYRPLNNKAVDRLFIYLRTRFGDLGIKKNEAAREMINIKKDGKPSLVIFIADQTPSRANLHYWTDFLNQDSAILTGPERIAKKLDIPVVYNDVRKVKRGYYTVDFKMISEHPKDESEFYITEQYARLMEASILRDPAFWLWTHKRWKHKKELVTNGK